MDSLEDRETLISEEKTGSDTETTDRILDLESGTIDELNQPAPGMWLRHTDPIDCCIYRVPDCIRQVNPEAYTPQLLIIGPLHHSLKCQALKSRGDITNTKLMGYLNMERHKKFYLADFTKRLEGEQTIDGLKKIIEEEEKMIRASYSESTEWIESPEFIDMILHDSVFIIEFIFRISENLLYTHFRRKNLMEESSRGGASHTEASHGGSSHGGASHGSAFNAEPSHGSAFNAEASHGSSFNAEASHGKASDAEAFHGEASHAEAFDGGAFRVETSHAEASHGGASHGSAFNAEASHRKASHEEAFHGDPFHGKASYGEISIRRPLVRNTSHGIASIRGSSIGRVSIGEASHGGASIRGSSIGRASHGGASIGGSLMRNASNGQTSHWVSFIRKKLWMGELLVDVPSIYHTIIYDLMLLENQLPYVILEKLSNGIVSKLFPEMTFRKLVTLTFIDGGEIKDNSKFLHFTDLIRLVHVETLPEVFLKVYNKPLEHMYTATKLDSGGVEFEAVEESFSLNVRFENGCLKLPSLAIVDKVEVGLRNIIALEQCHYPYQAHVCNYVDFLDRLIDSHKDIEFLIDKGIIKNWIGQDSLVAEMVNKLCLGVFSCGSYYSNIADEVNAYYKNPINKSRAILKRVYFGNLWTGTASVAATFLLLMTLIQTVASIIQTKN